MQNRKLVCLFIVNCDMHLVRDIEDRLVPSHSEGDFWLLKSLELHEMILRAQKYALEVMDGDTSAFQE